MLIAINKTSPGKPNIETLSSREYVSSFINHEIDRNLFIEYIRTGYAFCAALTKPYRIRRNFLASQVIAVDFDTGDNRSSLDYLMDNDFIREYGAFLYTTPSHTVETPRARAVFVLSTPIYDANSFEIMTSALLNKMENNDPSCKDAVRIFFGSIDCEVMNIGKTLPSKWFFHKVAVPYAKGIAQFQESVSSNIVYNGSGTYALRQMIKNGIHKIANAQNGERNNTLNSVAFVFGGLISAGYNFSQLEATTLLVEAAQNIPDPLPRSEIERTVHKSVTRGLSRPVYLNDPHADFINAMK